MAGYLVTLLLDRSKATKAEVAFLGPMKGTVNRIQGMLQISLGVDAADDLAALARARELILPNLPAKIVIATISATEGMSFGSSRRKLN